MLRSDPARGPGAPIYRGRSLRTVRHYPKLWMLLALVMLLAQWGAQAHAYSHLATAPNSSQHHARPVPCDECSNFAPLLTAVNSVSCATEPAVIDHSCVCSHQTDLVHHAAICRAYRSRAPPIRS